MLPPGITVGDFLSMMAKRIDEGGHSPGWEGPGIGEESSGRIYAIWTGDEAEMVQIKVSPAWIKMEATDSGGFRRDWIFSHEFVEAAVRIAVEFMN